MRVTDLSVTDAQATAWYDRYTNSASRHIYSASIVLALLAERKQLRQEAQR